MTTPLPQEVAELRALIIVDELHMSAVEALDKLCALAAAATPNARLRSAAERAVKGFGTGGSESAFAIDALRAALLASPAPASDHTDAEEFVSKRRCPNCGDQMSDDFRCQRCGLVIRIGQSTPAPAAADARLPAFLGRLQDWSLRHGAELKPTAGSDDSFGDGMREAKRQIQAMVHVESAALEAATPQPAPPKTAEAEQGEDATQDVLDELAEERRKQTKKWGEQNHDFSVWLAILSEEIGEASHEFLHAHFENTKKADEHASNLHVELVQSAAVLVAMLECGYRNAWWPRSELSRRAQGGAK